MRRFGGSVARVLLLLTLAGCGVRYGFAGGGLPDRIKTIAVVPLENETSSPEVQQELLEHLRREMRRRLGLREATQDRAHAIVRGTIQAYDPDVPVSFSAGQASARRRVAITVDIAIVDQSNGRILYERKGLRAEGEYAERAEAEGRRAAITKLVSDIVEGAQSQW